MSSLEYLSFFEYKVTVLTTSRYVLWVLNKLFQLSVSSIYPICV